MLRAVAQQSGGPPRLWGFFQLSSDQAAGISVGSPVRFEVRDTGDIALSAYGFTLPAGGVFSLEAACKIRANSASSGYMNYRWYDVTNAAHIGSSAYVSAQNQPTASSEQPASAAIVSTTVETRVELRITAVSNIAEIAANPTYAKILQIA